MADEYIINIVNVVRDLNGVHFRLPVTVATYEDALAEATGVQKKEITVLIDETDDNEINNMYWYNGVEGELELNF